MQGQNVAIIPGGLLDGAYLKMRREGHTQVFMLLKQLNKLFSHLSVIVIDV